MPKRNFYFLSSILIFAFCILSFFVFVPAFSGDLIITPGISIGSFQLRWYGLIIAASILTAFFVARKNAWRFGIGTSDVDDYSFWVVLLGFLGARVYFVIFNLDYFFENPSEIYKIWHGGLSIYGAVISGIIFTYFYTRKKAYSFWQMFDLAALSLPLAQALGRVGNFVNYEAFGLPTDLPWKMFVPIRFRPSEFVQNAFYHPTFLYEIILNLLVFGVLYKLLGKTKSGVLALSYILLYSFGRFFIESIRLDSFFVGGFRVDQIVAFILIITAGLIIFYKQKQA